MAAPPSIIIDVEDDSDKENEAPEGPVASGHTASFEADCTGTVSFTWEISRRKLLFVSERKNLSFRESPDPIWTAGHRFTLW